MRTILSLGNLVKLIYAHDTIFGKFSKTDDVILFNFIPAITGGYLCSDNDRILLSLPVRFSRLAILLFHNDAKYEYETQETKDQNQIKDQYQIYSTVNQSKHKFK